MRVFVTGATGWIGSAVVPELVEAGHDVLGLARSDDALRKLESVGAQAVRGSLDDLDVLAAAAVESDGVIHLAFKHEQAFAGEFAVATAADRAAIDVLGGALENSDRPLVIASGFSGHSSGALATETDAPRTDSVAAERMLGEQQVLALAARGVRSVSVRLAPTVHGDGDGGFLATLVQIARERGVSAYIGEGSNHWPAVHRFDAARLFRLAFESAPAGSVLHGVADEGVTMHKIAGAIGQHLDLPIASIPRREANEHFGWLAGLLELDIVASSDITRRLVGWIPPNPGLLDDLALGHYFPRRSRP